MQALQIAITDSNQPLQGLIHHSDRGMQYCCGDYITVLSTHKIQPSMTQSGDPRENPLAEHVKRTIKEEFMENYKQGYETQAQAVEEIPRNITFYNQVLPHSSVDR